MTELIVIAALAVVCWLFRVTFVLAIPPEKLPPSIHRGLTYLAPAVLAALAAAELTSVLTPADPLASGLALAAAVVVAGIAIRFRNLTLSVVSGLISVLALDLLVPLVG